MESIEPAALWLALIVGAWAALAARVRFGDDPRLVRSGARALHAAAALLVVAVATFLAAHRGDPDGMSLVTRGVTALRALLSAPDGMLLLAGTVAALATSRIPHLTSHASLAERRGANFRGGLLVAAGALVAILARASWGDAAERTTPVDLFAASGIAFRVLYAAGIGLLAAPVALGPVAGRAATRLRHLTAALAVQLLALTLGAWSRYAAVTPAAELDPTGGLLDPQWTTVSLLLLVPMVLTAAAVAVNYARMHHTNARSLPAVLLLLVGAAMSASAVAPAVLDWVVGRDVEFGMPLSPLHAWEASFALAVGVLLIAWLGMRAVRARSLPVRLMRVATACAVSTVALAVFALSTEARQLTIAPGATAPIRAMGQEWRFASQGTSQEEAATYDGALVAFEVITGSTSTIATAGERIYRDAHGHPAGRVAVPGLVRGLAGDLRFTVRALRGDEVLLRAQFHPLASVAWLMAMLTVVAFGTFAFLRSREVE